MGLRIEAPKQDGNARFNTLKVNLQQNLSATRGVVADEQGNFYYGVAGSGGAGFPFSGSAQITGSLGVTGSINIIDGGITGSLYGTSSWAISASYVANAPTAETASYVLSSNVDGPLGMDSILSASYSVSSSNSRTASYAFNAETASFVTASSVFGPYGSSSIESASYAVSTSYTNYAVTASHALTASSADDFLVRGTLTAQTIVAQIITSSTQYITGSTIFGSELTNTHVFTGSVSITGSLDVYGPANFYGPITGSIYGTASYAPNIYNSDGTLTGNRVMSGSQYNLTLDPSLTFNSSIVGYSRKTFYSNAFSTTTSSFNTASVLISANTTQSGSLGGLYGLINNIHVIAENQGNNTQGVAIGYQSNTQLTGVYTSSRMYVVGSRVLVSRFGVSSSLDQSNNANNYLAGQEIITTYNGFSGGVTSSYTGQHLGLSITNTIVNGNIGDLYGVRVQNNISNFTTYTGSTTNNYYGIRLQASIGTTSAAITTSIQNYYAAHISSLSIGATGRVTNLYGVYAEDSRMAHYFNGNVGIKTTRPAYEIDVVGSTRTQTNSNFGILANPTGTPTATPLTTGGALADGTYYYSITALDNYYAQTTGSAIASASISGGGGSGSVQLSWTAVPGATYYVIHRGTTLGTFNTAFQSAQITTTFTDVGGASAGFGFPTNNLTAVSQIASNGNLNVGSGLITYGNGTGPPLRTLTIRRLTGWAVKTGIVIGSGNSNFPSVAYPDNTALPFVFGEFNTLTGSRYYVIGDNNDISPSATTNILDSLFIGYNNIYRFGVNVTAIGKQHTINTSNTDNGCSITIGRRNGLNHRSVLIGTEVESTADGQLVIGQNNPSENLSIRDVYFGNGIRNKFDNVNANFGNGFNVTINGSGPTASADLAGGSLILAGGKGTGAGTPGDLIFSTSARLASGVTLQSLNQRVWIKGDTGNVGIATSAPTEKLEINGSVYVNSDNSGFIIDAAGNKRVGFMKYFGREAGIWRTGSGQDFEIGRVLSGSLTSPNTLVTDLYIDGNGNVGINTTNPSLANLQVQGNVWALSYTGSLQGTSSWSQNSVTASTILGGSTNYITLWNTPTTLSSSLIYQTGSSIGIGIITPTASLHLVGNSDTSSFVFYTEATGGLGSFRIYNDVRGISNPGISSSLLNESFGYKAMQSSSIPSSGLIFNSAFGVYAMEDSRNTGWSTAVGLNAMWHAVGIGVGITGSTAIGFNALAYQQSGQYNVAVGYNTLRGISTSTGSTGDRNTAVGSSALAFNTSGQRNNAFGDSALGFNTVGSFNTANGNRALIFNVSGSYNTALGVDSLRSSTTASYGTAIGGQALYDSLTGDRNIGIGWDSGRGITTGRANVIIGSVTGLSAGLSNNIILADGDGNRRINVDSTGNVGINNINPLYTLDVSGSLKVTSSVLLSGLTTSPQSNVITIDTTTGQLYYTASSAIGGTTLSGGTADYVARWDSPTTLTIGSIFDNGTNVGIGTVSPSLAKLQVQGNVWAESYTGSLFGTASWAVSASWAPNTGGSSQWTSSGANIYFNVGNVGVGTNSPAYPFDVSGNTRLVGSLAVGNITPSGTSGRIDASNDIVAFSSSDIRFKTNLKPIANPIDKINKVSGYEFDWIPDQENHGHEGHDIGVIAQEIEEILPEIVTTRESGYKAVKYEKIVPLLIEAIKEQQKQIDELRYLLQNK